MSIETQKVLEHEGKKYTRQDTGMYLGTYRNDDGDILDYDVVVRLTTEKREPAAMLIK